MPLESDAPPPPAAGGVAHRSTEEAAQGCPGATIDMEEVFGAISTVKQPGFAPGGGRLAYACRVCVPGERTASGMGKEQERQVNAGQEGKEDG